MEGTGVEVRGQAPNDRNMSRSPTSTEGDNSANEHHPEAHDDLQTLDKKMSFVAPCGRILMAAESCWGTEQKLASAWRLVNKQS